MNILCDAIEACRRFQDDTDLRIAAENCFRNWSGKNRQISQKLDLSLICLKKGNDDYIANVPRLVNVFLQTSATAPLTALLHCVKNSGT